MEGRCQCGKVTFTTPTPAPIKVYICHCLECRHQSSSAFGISAQFPTFELPPQSRLNTDVYTRTTLSGRDRHCYFCKSCGSRIMHGGTNETTVNVKGGCLEGLTTEMVQHATHIWTKRAVVPIPVLNGVESYEEEPPKTPGGEE